MPTTTDPVEALINRTWRPTLSVTGVDGVPEIGNAGNVLRPYTAFKLSLRLPPLIDGNEAASKLKALLEDNAPYNAKVTFARMAAPARSAPRDGTRRPIAPWLERALNDASLAHYGAPLGYIGQGGTIPLMSMLQKGFPTRADDGVRRARPEEQRARAERVPVRALRQAAHRRGRAGDGGVPVGAA